MVESKQKFKICKINVIITWLPFENFELFYVPFHCFDFSSLAFLLTI
jgi:hypothetical protein